MASNLVYNISNNDVIGYCGDCCCYDTTYTTQLDYCYSEIKTLEDKIFELYSENEKLKKDITDLQKVMAYLNTRVNNLLAEKQIKEKNE